MNTGPLFQRSAMLGRATLALALFAMGSFAHGQLVVLKNGNTIPAKGLRREGEMLMNQVEIAGRPAETGYPVKDIDHLEIPEPPQLGKAEQDIVIGKPAEAIPLLDPLIAAYYPLRDIKGVYWGQASLLKSAALQALGKRDEATVLLTLLSEYTLDPHISLTAKARLAGLLAMGGKARAPQAITLADAIIGSTDDSGALSEAWLAKGRALFVLNNFDGALDAFLRLPVFYDDNPSNTAQALLGCGRCYLAMQNYKRAARSFIELQERYGTTPEAAESKKEIEKGGREMAAMVKQVLADHAEDDRKLKEANAKLPANT